MAAREHSRLYHDLTRSALEVRLLADMVNLVGPSTEMGDVIQAIESGIKAVLSTKSWSALKLALLDDTHQYLHFHQVVGGGGSRYWSNVRNGALAAGRDLGIRVDFVAGGASGTLTQADAVSAGVQAGVQGIALAPIDAVGIEPMIGAARQTGIPVVTFDTPPIEGSQSLLYIGTDNLAAGQLAGETLKRILPQGGLVGVSLDSLLAVNGAQRLTGLTAAIAGSSIRALPPYEQQYDADLGARLARATLAEHPDLVGVVGICSDDGPNWGMAAEAAGRAGAIKIVCFDISVDSVDMLKKGIVHAVIAQREYAMGYQSVQLLCPMIIDGVERALAELPTSPVLDTGVDVVTLERTPWSIALADYIVQHASRKPFDRRVRMAIERYGQPIRLLVVGMAERSDVGRSAWTAPFESGTFVGQVLTTGQSLVVAPDEPAFEGAADVAQARRAGRRTLVGLPLLVHGDVLGALILESDLEQACGPDDLALLERLAGTVATVVENARMLDQQARRARDLEALARHQEALLQTIRELSSPVVPIAAGILVIPLIGVIDTQRANSFLETLLEAISARQASVALIDITGVAVVDTAVAHHLLQAARAAQLLGAQVVLVGITPAVAQTMIQLGVDLSGIVTRADLESGFAYALSHMNGQIVYNTLSR